MVSFAECTDGDKIRGLTLMFPMETQAPPPAAKSAIQGNDSAAVGPRTPRNFLDRLRALLARRVDGRSLALFRIFVGIVMGLEAYSLFQPSASTGGKVPFEVYYAASNIHFPYPGFAWLPFFSPAGMHVVAGLLALGALLVTVGFFYRVGAVLLFLSWGYFYAIESTRTYWMSYYYLELLTTFLLVWMPAARNYSINSVLKKTKDQLEIPFWPIFLLRAQLFITYFYAGVAKLNADWLLDAQPVQYYLSQPNVSNTLRRIFGESHTENLLHFLHGTGLAYFLSWAGAAFDLSVGFLLCWRPTRILGFALLVLFHATNHSLLFNDIEWFPLLGIATATIFFPPDWPSRIRNWRKRPRQIPGRPTSKPMATTIRDSALNLPLAKWTMPLILGWIVFQTLVPLRQYIIPGDARITFEGLSFSWRLKAEVYRTTPCEIFIHDPAVISQDKGGTSEVHWAAWLGDRSMYLPTDSRAIPWEDLPEIVVTSEPATGERIFYNPYSANAQAHSENEIRDRVASIWMKSFGRNPDGVYPTVPPEQILRAYSAAMRNHDANFAGTIGLQTLLRDRKNPQIMKLLSRMNPFALDQGPARRLYLIESGGLFSANSDLPSINRQVWKSGAESIPREWSAGDVGNAIFIVISDLWSQTPELFPEHLLIWSTNGSLRIAANYRKSLPISKVMHISTQPFLLRDYARHIAGQWKSQFGHRPAVTAKTGVSLNFRPPQMVVNPEADLASVPASRSSHNAWIPGLQTRRIPGNGLIEKPL